jgi:hypothetical protein
MNKEQQELLDEAYDNYSNKLLFNEKDCHIDYSINQPNKTFIPYSQEEFINKCKTDTGFSKKWGLKIEERDLNHDERFRIAYKNLELRKKLEAQSKMLHYPDGHNKVMDDANIPTKLITITYQDKTIESYE